MWTYDGQNFETLEELLSYVGTQVGESFAQSNATHIQQFGTALDGSQVYYNGVKYTGIGNSFYDQLSANGWLNVDGTVNQTKLHVYQNWSVPEYSQLQNTMTQSGSASYGGISGSNIQIQMADGETAVSGMNTTITSDNGSVSNSLNLIQTDNPVTPLTPIGASLLAMATYPVSSAAVAIGAALGVPIGVGIYDLNPEFWEKVSRTLLPWCYGDPADLSTLKMWGAVTGDGSTYFAVAAIEALRQLFVDEGVYDAGSITPPPEPESTVYYEYNRQNPDGTEDHNYSSFDPVYYVNTIPYVIQTSMQNILIRSGNDFYPIQGFYSSDTEDDFPTPDAIFVSVSGNNGLTIIPIWVNKPATNASGIGLIVNSYKGGYAGRLFKYIFGNDYIYAGYAIGLISGYWSMTNPPAAKPSNTMDATAYSAYVSLFGTGGSEVPGTSLEPGAVYPTDTLQNLGEIYPDWDADKISVITDPTQSTLEDASQDLYPVSLSKTNYSSDTNDTYSTETQEDTQTGTNPDNTQIEQIAQAILDFINELTENGTLPSNPTIPIDPTGDTPTPTPPMITGAGSDLIAIYNPTKEQLQAFNQFLWDLDPTNLINWKKVIGNPIEAVISLSMIYATPITGESRHIKCGYIETDVSSLIVTNQYVDIDCGTVEIKPYFYNIWDYKGTHISIYLPFIGIVPLHVGDIMGSVLRVRYKVDVYTGTCLAQLIVLRGNSLATLYTYAGNCSVQLPLTSGSFSGLIGSLLTAGGMALFGGGPAMALGQLANTALSGGIQQNIQRSGNIGANAGAMGIRTPYLIITRIKTQDAFLYNEQYGFPANKTIVLGNVSGYTRVKSVHLSGIPCTDDELEQIERLLKEGVIIN